MRLRLVIASAAVPSVWPIGRNLSLMKPYQCLRCGIINQPQDRFCFKCGARLNFRPVPPTPTRNTNNWRTKAFWIGVVGIVMIGGALQNKNEESKTPAPTTANITASPTPPLKTTASSVETLNKAQSLVQGERSRDDYYEAIRLLRSIPQEAKEYRKAQSLLKTSERNIARLDAEESKPPPIKREANEIDQSGATARCRDGSLSYSQHRQGTCSHHGGVAQWY